MPLRLQELARRVRELDDNIGLDTGSKHWRFSNSEGKVYPIPAPNGMKSEIDNKYIRGLCRCYGLDFGDLMRR